MNAKRSARRVAQQREAQHRARTRHMHDARTQRGCALHCSGHTSVHLQRSVYTVSTALSCAHSRALSVSRSTHAPHFLCAYRMAVLPLCCAASRLLLVLPCVQRYAAFFWTGLSRKPEEGAWLVLDGPLGDAETELDDEPAARSLCYSALSWRRWFLSWGIFLWIWRLLPPSFSPSFSLCLVSGFYCDLFCLSLFSSGTEGCTRRS